MTTLKCLFQNPREELRPQFHEANRPQEVTETKQTRRLGAGAGAAPKRPRNVSTSPPGANGVVTLHVGDTTSLKSTASTFLIDINPRMSPDESEANRMHDSRTCAPAARSSTKARRDDGARDRFISVRAPLNDAAGVEHLKLEYPYPFGTRALERSLPFTHCYLYEEFL